MLPLHQAKEIRDSLKAYLRASFDFISIPLKHSFEQFIDHPEQGLFKGPYLSVKLPFVKASEEALENLPLQVKPEWSPYRHQILSWERLSSRDQEPLPTLVTTGTGSGKTESFLFPVLDYCLKEKQNPGIKCIIMYPMNALATDQAKRLAEIIQGDPRLRGKVTAGLFIGDSSNASLPTMMGEDHIVENRDAILSDPPDILLTNFKMLDYGLMRHNFDRLWRGNYDNSDLLKFLVLDEMHTYDGAQGTDVANLIRRLKLKLNLPKGRLCPVGTSATLGSGEKASGELAIYASTIFGEDVTEDAVISESRVSLHDYFGDPVLLDPFLPRPAYLSRVEVERDANYDEYIAQLATMWQLDTNNLADGLRGLRVVHDLVSCCTAEPGVHRLDRLVESMDRTSRDFRGVAGKRFSPQEKSSLIESLVALIGAAKEGGAQASPMLFVQVQMWVRELSGVRRLLSDQPSFVWRDEPVDLGKPKHMPPWYCRDCGTSGWLISKSEHRNILDPADGEGTEKFFRNHKNTHFLIASNQLSRKQAAEGGYDTRDSFEAWLSPSTLELSEKPQEGAMKVFGARRLDSKGKNDHVCPSCNTRNSLSIIGSRVATLGSITVSQILASEFDDTPEKDRKVLAFTNSVQDAAHQAGFIEARNYRFTMRASIQRVLNRSKVPLRIPELQDAFKSFWSANADEHGTGNIAAYYNRFFPKDYIGRSEPDDYKRNGKYLPLFEEAFDERISWEILNEFGFESLLGRTLEKTGCAGMWLDPELVNRTATGIASWVGMELTDGQIPLASLPRFIALLAHRMRSRGAVDHSLLSRFRQGKLERGDLNWYQSQRHILHRWFASRTRLPRMVIHHIHSTGIGDSTYSRPGGKSNSPNWFHAYFRKSFPMANSEVGFVNEFYARLFSEGTQTGLFSAEDGSQGVNHALESSAMFVAAGVESYRCNTCGHALHEGKSSDKPNIDGGACLIYRCTGSYKRDVEDTEANYYQLVYNRTRSPRVYAREHTGLLERKTREILEREFKDRVRFNAANTLVATSTLEMGIDIGSLQVALNTSVPPTPSNFLQRVGRAGRKSGTALIVNFAKSRSHDQYYYSDPDEMMTGDVSSPGCYLEAREILRRHYFAFCIDTWTAQNPSEHRIPTLVRHLSLLEREVNSPEFFMTRILSFASKEEESLVERFTGIYAGEVSEATLVELETWVRSIHFKEFHQNIFNRLKEELQKLQEEKQRIEKRILDERLGEEDDLYKELKQEQGSLGGMITLIRKRSVLEHLTNVGALPNYAFPETGVTLNARVFKQAGRQALRSPLNKEYVIVRSASQALRELVPGSAFYSQGYRLEIGGLNASDLRGEGERFMRFCSNCDHLADSTTPLAELPCPKCGDESWKSSSNRHRVAYLTNVRSSTSSSRSRVADLSETRTGEAFQISRHFKFKRSEGAWGIARANFGYEFFRETEVTEFNLGLEARSQSANQIEINGAKYPNHGFITCKSCGKSTPKRLFEARDYHYAYCPNVDKAWTEADNSFFHELFLFRRVSTEALKVLAPIRDLTEGTGDLDLFQAGLELGFRHYFKGNPQHLLIRPYQEYNQTSGRKDLYLVILDHVPGGTGYLERLFNPEEFSKVLGMTYKALEECTCHLEGKDGCYRCVYSYRNQRAHGDLSRKRGIELFKSIVERSESWERLADGLNPIIQSGRLEESELETKFIGALKRFSNAQEEWEFAEELVDTSIHYILKCPSGYVYHVQPQVELGPNQGFERATRPDFVFTATHSTPEMEEELEAVPQVAVYLDGFQYHTSAEHPRFRGDIEKREQLRNNPAYMVWTMTWNDLVRFEADTFDGVGGDMGDFLANAVASPPARDNIARLAEATGSGLPETLKWPNNLSRLLGWLQKPIAQPEPYVEWIRLLAGFQLRLFARTFGSSNEALSTYLSGPECQPERTLDVWVPLNLPSRDTGIANLKVICNLEQDLLKVSWELRNLDNVKKDEWEAFWTWYNILQFATWVDPLSARIAPLMPYKKPAVYSELRMVADSEACPDEPWLKDMIEFFKDYEDEVRDLWTNGYFQTEEDETALTELMNTKGEGIASAVFIHPETKQVYYPSSIEDEKVFVDAGYSIMTSVEE